MATTLTTNYSLGKPAKSDVGWWSVLNANFDTIDTTLASTASTVAAMFSGGIFTQTRLHLTGGLPTVPNSQGTWLQWNRSIGQGEVNLMCHRGGAPGGFYFEMTADGTTFLKVAQVDQSFGEGETALILLCVSASVTKLVRVSMGAINSGGAGFRMLRVIN